MHTQPPRPGQLGFDPLPTGGGALEQAFTDWLAALLHVLPADPSADPDETAGAVALVRTWARTSLRHVDAPSIAGDAAQLRLGYERIGGLS